MKAAVLFAPNDVRVADFKEPEFKENSIKVKVEYCGICGTDFHKFAGKTGVRKPIYPIPLGHEASGTVVEVGEKTTGFKVGDRVTVDPNWSCGECFYCKNGKRHLCPNSKGVVKGMAEYICPPIENVYHIPDSLSLLDAALTEPLSCCLRGVDLMDIKLGETVCIIGLGAIGQLILQLVSKSSAANIVVIEPVEEKREIAKQLGATLFINPNTQNAQEELQKAGIQAIEKVIECVGLPQTASNAIDIASKGATVVLFGVADADAILPIKQYEFFSKDLTIKASYLNPYTTQRAIDLLASGAIDTKVSISKVIDLQEVPEELKTRKYSRLGKVIVHVH